MKILVKLFSTHLFNKKELKIPSGKKINHPAFEKDDPTNYHIDLIYSIANLRARNYKVILVSMK